MLGEIIAVEAAHGQPLARLKIPRLMLPELAGGALLSAAARVSLLDRTFYNPTAMRVILNDKTHSIMQSMDEIRKQIKLKYPNE